MKLWLVIVFPCIAFTFKPRNCGMTAESDVFKILGGRYVDPSEFPWIVAISVNGADCTGSLISDRHVITAAHCFTKSKKCRLDFDDVEDVKVCHGIFNLQNRCHGVHGTKYHAKKIFFLDRYLEEDCANEKDLVILELNHPVEDAVPICLPIEENGPVFYDTDHPKRLTITGYGNNDDVGSIENTGLTSGDAGKPMECRELDGPFICTKYGNKNAAICGGDSGGPMSERHHHREILVGINTISQGGLCSFDGIIKVHKHPFQAAVEVTHYLNDILSVVGDYL